MFSLLQIVCSDCPVSSFISPTSYNNIYLHVLVYIIFYLFTFVIAEQKDLLIESAKASQCLQPTCAQQALAGWLGGGIVPPLAADAVNLLVAVQQAPALQGDGGDGNGSEENVKEAEPDNEDDEDDQAMEVYVGPHIFFVMFS